MLGCGLAVSVASGSAGSRELAVGVTVVAGCAFPSDVRREGRKAMGSAA